MKSKTDHHEIDLNESSLPEHEQIILDTALRESDQLLARTLHDDEKRRRRRRLILWSAILIGGVVMTKLMMGLMSGWLVASLPAVAETKPAETVSGASEEIAKAFPGPTDEQWRMRLLAVHEDDSWFVGAKIGLELVQIPGDRPYKILAASWRKIATSARKQILKGFSPGMMGNKKMHPRFFDVMHLGMSDKDADVRSYAATYIEMQGLPNFKNDKKGYTQWHKENENRSAKEIIASVAKVDSTKNDLQRGWQMFFRQKYGTSERLFRRVLENDPDNLAALNGLGFSVLNQGDHQQAKPMFEKYLKMNKNASGPMNGLARCLKAEGKVNEAIKVWERAAKNAPGPNDITVNLAMTYLEQKQFAKAVKYFKIQVKLDPKNKYFQKGLEQAQAGLSTTE